MDNEFKGKILNLRECAEILKVHPDTIKRAIRAGKLKAFRSGSRGSGTFKILEENFKIYLDSMVYTPKKTEMLEDKEINNNN